MPPKLRDTDVLAGSLTGSVLEPDHPDFDEARQMWNGSIHRRPALIVRCVSNEDVVAAIDFARRSELKVTVRGGGHSMGGRSIADGAMMIDVGPMKRIAIDAEGRRVVAESGLLGAELDRATQAQGLATTLGTVSHTGIAGLTLGGGMGWLMRKLGLAADNVLSAELVLADGRNVVVDAASDPDLLWAVRGGGGEFGVVTRFEYALHPIGPELSLIRYVFDFDQGRDALTLARDIARDSGRDRDVFMMSLRIPDLDRVPPPIRGRHVYYIVGVSIDPNDLETNWLSDLDGLRPLLGQAGRAKYVDVQSIFDLENPHGTLAYSKGAFVAKATDEVLDEFARQAAALPGRSFLYLQQMGGAVADLADDATAVRHRSADYVLNVIGVWDAPEDAQSVHAWVRGVVSAFAPYILSAAPLNFDGGSEKFGETIFGPVAKRLAAIKASVDPDRMFEPPAADRRA
jgi:FAD/FMN-containing dehydrogenase